MDVGNVQCYQYIIINVSFVDNKYVLLTDIFQEELD